jgi:gliding motility-associated-like protein
MLRNHLYIIFVFISFFDTSNAQNVELLQQFNGRFDYTAIGNTMNLAENESSNSENCVILTSSSAELNLQSTQTIEKAYLYWAGSGDGDFNVTLNGNDITAERTFENSIGSFGTFFAAFTDVTELILSQGNVTYTLSDLDLTNVIEPFCINGLNFAGWSIIIVYKEDSLPLNQVNVYDGLQSVPSSLTIVLDNLNVLDNQGAKIGFLAWEGDAGLAVNEQLTINGNILENLPLNPANNAFNGTNSFTGQSDLYNMDIDVYDIENNINIGDTTATIQLTSGQDVVFINNIITVLNSQLPDATISLDSYFSECGSRLIELDYTVYNTNSTDPLPAQTPIAFYIDTILIATTETENVIAINASESNSILIDIPFNFSDNFEIIAIVDDDGFGNGIITEINENNNGDIIQVELLTLPDIIELEPLIACDVGFNTASFDLTEKLSEITFADIDLVSFYTSIEDLINLENQITIPEDYTNFSDPQTVFIRVENNICFDLYSFQLTIENCPPFVPQGFSPNEDGYNDWFNIQGLYNIFDKHELLIYNRYGSLIFKGNNDTKWFGKANIGLPIKNKLVPVGTYFYVLNLNDSNYKLLTGWVYLNR